MKERLRRVLREVVTSRSLELVATVDYDAMEKLTREQADQLERAILSEFIATGLGPGDEPNARGLALEDLLDELRRARRWEDSL